MISQHKLRARAKLSGIQSNLNLNNPDRPLSLFRAVRDGYGAVVPIQIASASRLSLRSSSPLGSKFAFRLNLCKVCSGIREKKWEYARVASSLQTGLKLLSVSYSGPTRVGETKLHSKVANDRLSYFQLVRCSLGVSTGSVKVRCLNLHTTSYSNAPTALAGSHEQTPEIFSQESGRVAGIHSSS